MADPVRSIAIADPLDPSPPLAGLRAAIRSHALVCLREPDFKTARRHPAPIPAGWEPISGSLLRSSDEQTVAGVSAVLGAVADWREPPVDEFAAWGLVAASRFLGRSHLVVDLKRFFAEGVWGVSPHIIPHYALHSQAGTLSQAIGLHGPNLGVGGGPDAAFQGLLTALTWLAGGSIPGVWLVLSGWSPELVPDASGRPISDCECQALALALVAPERSQPGQPWVQLARGDSMAPTSPIDLVDFATAIAENRRQSIAADVTGRMRVELIPGRGGDR